MRCVPVIDQATRRAELLRGMAIACPPWYASGRIGLFFGDATQQIAVAAAMSPSHAELILLGILTVTSYSLVGLLAIWAGLGRPHWFLRVAVVGGILLLLLLIPAYEPLLLFSTLRPAPADAAALLDPVGHPDSALVAARGPS